MQCKLDLVLCTYDDTIVPFVFRIHNGAASVDTIPLHIATVLYDTATQKFIPDAAVNFFPKEWLDFEDIRVLYTCHPAVDNPNYSQAIRVLGAENLGRYIQSYTQVPSLQDVENYVLACKQSGQVVGVTMNFPHPGGRHEDIMADYHKVLRSGEYMRQYVVLERVQAVHERRDGCLWDMSSVNYSGNDEVAELNAQGNNPINHTSIFD